MGVRAPTFYGELVEDALDAGRISVVDGGYGLVTTLQAAQRLGFVRHGSNPRTIKRWIETYQAYGLVATRGGLLVLTHMDISARLRYQSMVIASGLTGQDLSAEARR